MKTSPKPEKNSYQQNMQIMYPTRQLSNILANSIPTSKRTNYSVQTSATVSSAVIKQHAQSIDADMHRAENIQADTPSFRPVDKKHGILRLSHGSQKIDEDNSYIPNSTGAARKKINSERVSVDDEITFPQITKAVQKEKEPEFQIGLMNATMPR